MYSWMAVATFILFKDESLEKTILDILVYDADCHAFGIHGVLSGECMVD